MRFTRIVLGTLGAAAALAIGPSMSGAQDTTRTGQVATGEVRSERINNLGLARRQVERLQQRLNEIGCDAGAVDGLIGPRTREAMDCARTRENITGQDVESLLRALGLDAAQRDSVPMPRDTMMRDTMMRDTLRPDSIPMRMLRDTMRSDSLRLDTLRDTTRIPRDPTRRPPPR